MINIQVISDANCRINHVFANYPGSSHDSFMGHGCVDDINEDRLENLRRRDAELHVPMPLRPNAAARERRAHLSEELHRI